MVHDTTVTDEDGNTEEVSLCDIGQVADALQDAGLIQYKWLFASSPGSMTPTKRSTRAPMCSTPIWTTWPWSGGCGPPAAPPSPWRCHPEGYNTQQIFQLLSENGVAPVEELEEAAANYEFVDYASWTATCWGM